MIAKPLTELTQKNHSFHWTDLCDKAFLQLKKILTGPDIMGYPDPKQSHFHLDTDACDVGIGAVLRQIQDGREKV